MRLLLRSVLALSILSVLTMSQSAEAETSEDFNGVELYFYGDLDDGDGNISTLIPVDESDTQSDCPTDSNQLSWPMGQRNWGEVGSWIVYFDTSGQLDTGDYTLTLWANSTQGTVEDVQFRMTLYIYNENCNPESAGSQNCRDAESVATSQSKTVTESSEEATRFEISFDASNASFSASDKMEVLLEYSGGDPSEEPIVGQQSTDQIVVISSSTAHPAGINNLTLSHYRADFIQITMEDFQQRVYIRAQVWSAFGESDINEDVWTLGVYGESPGNNKGLTADFNSKTNKNGSYEVSFYWYYNKANAISDTYHFYIQITDVQDNTWEIVSDDNLYLVIHEESVDDIITPAAVQINNQTGVSRIQAGSSFTIDFTISVIGDKDISYNPIPVAIVWFSGSNEIILYETVVFAIPGAEATPSYRHTFEDAGEYLIKVILDKNGLVKETDESNNIAEVIIVVDEKDEGFSVQSLLDDLTGGGNTMWLVILATTSLLLGFYFMSRGKEDMDFEWEEDDDF